MTNTAPHDSDGVKLSDNGRAIDQYLVAHMPLWLRYATVQQVKELRAVFVLHQTLQMELQALMQRIQPLDRFASLLLNEALVSQMGLALNLSTGKWREVRVSGTTVMNGLMVPPTTTYTRHRNECLLLERALQNFSRQQMSSHEHPVGTGIVLAGDTVMPRPERFASLCRTLDIGGKYQLHLDHVFNEFKSSSGLGVAQLFAADKRCSLELQARISYQRGEIFDDTYLMLLQVTEGRHEVTLSGFKVQPSQLHVFGSYIPEAVVFEVLNPRLGSLLFTPEHESVKQLVVYLPNAPSLPLRVFESWRALATALEQDLQSESYFSWFTRQMNHELRQTFVSAYQLMRSEQRHAVDVLGVLFVEPLFLALANHQVERIKGGAAALAVPTAGIDLAVYQQRLETFKTIGLTLLGAVASFIPVLGEVMLATVVVQMLGEVYEGAEDWSHGRRHQALDHLLGIAENVAVMALVAGGGIAVGAVLKRSEFVDNLLPVIRDDEAQRLWNADLQPYALPEKPLIQGASEEGLVQSDGRQIFARDRHCYEVQQHTNAGHWQLRHPRRENAYSPRVEYNGEGAWRLPDEHPLQWSGIALLLRRLTPLVRGLTDIECEQVAQILNIDEGYLRGLHVEGHQLPHLLADTLALYRVDTRVSEFFAALTHATPMERLDPQLIRDAKAVLDMAQGDELPQDVLLQSLEFKSREFFDYVLSQGQPEVDAQMGVLRRDFPGLTPRAAQALIAHASPEQLQRLSSLGRVPLGLAQEARSAQRELRLMRALVGIELRNGLHPDSILLVFGLLRRRTTWPPGMSLELREGSVEGRVLAYQWEPAQATHVRVVVSVSGRFKVQGVVEEGTSALAQAPVDLFDAVNQCLSSQQRQALGWPAHNASVQMRSELLVQALNEREYCAQLLGMTPPATTFKSFHRLADGRFGYRLSGRGVGQIPSFEGMVRSLFPGFDDAQVQTFLVQIQGLGSNTMATLLRFQSAYRQLDTTLTLWQGSVGGAVGRARSRVADSLRRCWRRQSDQVYGNDSSVLGYRLRINDTSLADLPELPSIVDFSHVVDLNLAGTRLSVRADILLRHFTQVRWLDLSHCDLSEIPQALGRMSVLDELYLDNNQIQLSSAQANRLRGLNRLSTLNLDRNPLAQVPDLRQFTVLTQVRLRSTQLRVFPVSLLDIPALGTVDLRNNMISELPQEYFNAPAHIREAFVLHDNPLSLQALEQLRAIEEVVPERVDHVPAEQGRQRWLDASAPHVQTSRANMWQDLQHEPAAEDFLRILADLTETAEYRKARDYLAGRVWQMLEAMAENTTLREELFDMAGSPTTCVDSVSDRFSQLEVRFLLMQNTHVTVDRPQALLRFARRLFRLDMVEQIARSQIDARLTEAQLVDEVEVSLAYRTGLSRELELPGQPSHMLFRDIANVTPADLERAAQAVRVAEASDQLAHYISTRDFWLDYLREQHPARFAEVEQPFWDQLEVLTENPHGLPEGEYLQRINALRSQRETAVETLAHCLTLEALSAEADA